VDLYLVIESIVETLPASSYGRYSKKEEAAGCCRRTKKKCIVQVSSDLFGHFLDLIDTLREIVGDKFV
jgi:hypothetical protein